MAKGKGLAGLLKAASQKTSSGSKSGTPTVPLPATLHTFATQWFEGKEEELRGKSRREEAEGQLTPTADELLIDQCQKTGSFVNSIRLGVGNKNIMFQRQNRWCKIGKTEKRSLEQAEDILLNIFGDEDYQRYFTRKTMLKLDPEKLSDEQADAILKALGSTVNEVLEQESVILPKESLMVDCVSNTKLREKQQRAAREDLCVPYKASFKR